MIERPPKYTLFAATDQRCGLDPGFALEKTDDRREAHRPRWNMRGVRPITCRNSRAK
jgi:hypothetical protein